MYILHVHYYNVHVPAVQRTTISLGVFSIMSKLDIGLSGVPPRSSFKDWRSDCHCCLSEAGTIYTI